MLIFLKFESPEITGEIKHADFLNQIEAYSVSFGATREGIGGSASSGKAPPAIATPVSIAKPVDQSSVKLFERTMLGSLLGKVTISCCHSKETTASGSAPNTYVVYYQIVLTNAHLISFNTGTEVTGGVPADSLLLDYQKIDLLYTGSDGKGNFSGKWDLKTNSAR